MADAFDISQPLWTVARVAEVLSCSPDLVYRLHADGRLQAVNVGRANKRATLRFLPADVAAFVNGRRAIAATPAVQVRAALPRRIDVPRRVKTRTS